MQSAIGRIQLTYMPNWTAQRTRNAEALAEVCRKFDFLRVPEPSGNIKHAYYKFYVFVEPEKLVSGLTRDSIIKAINSAGIPCMQGSCSEVYLEKAFEDHPSKPKERLAVARELGEASLMFLVHPGISVDKMDQLSIRLNSVLISLDTISTKVR
jgi:dTDP-4-amino-4,6-dideoxygalactose transaminase